jgi:hypothetical protein
VSRTVWAFAVAAVLTDDQTGEVGMFTARCSVDTPTEPWVVANVLPAMADMPVTCGSYAELLCAWDRWYRASWANATIIGHVVWPVEARFLLDVHANQPATGPYPLIDVATLLLAAGHNPRSVDDYLNAHDLMRPPGSPHNPMYDACATETAFRHLMAARQGPIAAWAQS